MANLILFFLVFLAWSNNCIAALIFKDNFESYSDVTSTSSFWSHETSNISLDITGGVNDSKAIKFEYKGEIYAPFSHNLSSSNLASVYTKFKFKVAPGAAGGIKFLKILGKITNGNYYANWTWNFGPMTETPSYLTSLCFGNGTHVSNDTQVCINPPTGVKDGSDRFIGDIILRGNNFIPSPNIWYEVTTYNKYNSDGNADGEMWIAVNDVKLVHVINAKNRNDSDARAIHAISFGDYSNANSKITIWIDDVEFSDTPSTSN